MSLKWIKDLNIRPGFGNDFFGFDTKNKVNKSKNKQVGPYQTKRLLHSKGNCQQMKSQPT